MRDPRVEEAVEEIHREVREHHDHGGYEENSQKEIEVALLQRVEHEPPSPGQPNTVSIRIEPPSRWPSCRPASVTTGRSALRAAWLHATERSESPFARAVVMNSWPYTSSIEARMRRA